MHERKIAESEHCSGYCVSLCESLHAFVNSNSTAATAEAFTSYEDKAKLMVEDSIVIAKNMDE